MEEVELQEYKMLELEEAEVVVGAIGRGHGEISRIQIKRQNSESQELALIL